MIKMAKISFTAATLAAELSTDDAQVTPKQLRVFLRTPESGIAPVGKGGRYSLEMTAAQLRGFKKNFGTWKDAQDAARAARAAQAAEEKAAKELNVLTVATPADLDLTEVDEVEGPNSADLTDADFAEMLEEIANEDDEIEA